MKRELVNRYSHFDLDDDTSFERVSQEMEDFKSKYPNGTQFQFEKRYYDDSAYFTLTCRDLETDEEMEKRITLENNSIKCKEAKERAMYEQLKKKFEGEK